MGLMDTLKGLVGMGRDAAAENADKIHDVVDKAGGFIDEKTGGKYSDQIGKGAAALKGAIPQQSGADEAESAESASSAPEAASEPEAAPAAKPQAEASAEPAPAEPAPAKAAESKAAESKAAESKAAGDAAPEGGSESATEAESKPESSQG